MMRDTSFMFLAGMVTNVLMNSDAGDIKIQPSYIVHKRLLKATWLNVFQCYVFSFYSFCILQWVLLAVCALL